jgi:ribosome-associated protein
VTATGGADRGSSDEVVEWVRVAARAAASKTDGAIVVLDVADVLSITSWFVITSGGNTRQVRAIADEIEKKVAEASGPKPITVEGLDTGQWVLLNYGEFVVHVFDEEARSYYDLERLWRDVPRLDWESS